MTPPPVKPPLDERAAFEAWALSVPITDDNSVEHRDGRVVTTLSPWEAWQAARAPLLATLDALTARVGVLTEALRKIAYAEGDGPVTGSWDEPHSARIARAAIGAHEVKA